MMADGERREFRSLPPNRRVAQLLEARKVSRLGRVASKAGDMDILLMNLKTNLQLDERVKQQMQQMRSHNADRQRARKRLTQKTPGADGAAGAGADSEEDTSTFTVRPFAVAPLADVTKTHETILHEEI